MTTTAHDLREVLADVVVDTAVFCEIAGDDEINPDTAVRWLESLAATIEQLQATDRLWLFERVRARAANEAQPERRRALDSLAQELLEEPV